MNEQPTEQHMIETNEAWQRKLDERISLADSIGEIKEYIKKEKPQASVSIDNNQQGMQERVLIRRAMQMIQENPDVSDDQIEESLNRYLNAKDGLYRVTTLLNPIYLDDIIDQARLRVEN